MRSAIFTLVALGLAWSAPLTPAAAQGSVAIDEEELRLWAEKGEPDAQFDLGLRLVTGEGIKKNEKDGAEFIRKAAMPKITSAPSACWAPFLRKGSDWRRISPKRTSGI
jgi:TPR repeat protein